MPIYAYRCSHCGHAQDVLQKLSDPLLTVCPACGEASFTKQLTAAGFQLKGSGWYVTDFKGGGAPKKEGEPAKPAAGDTAAAGEAAAPAAAEGAAKPAEAAAKPGAAAPPAAPSTGSGS